MEITKVVKPFYIYLYIGREKERAFVYLLLFSGLNYILNKGGLGLLNPIACFALLYIFPNYILYLYIKVQWRLLVIAKFLLSSVYEIKIILLYDDIVLAFI